MWWQYIRGFHSNRPIHSLDFCHAMLTQLQLTVYVLGLHQNRNVCIAPQAQGEKNKLRSNVNVLRDFVATWSSALLNRVHWMLNVIKIKQNFLGVPSLYHSTLNNDGKLGSASSPRYTTTAEDGQSHGYYCITSRFFRCFGLLIKH